MDSKHFDALARLLATTRPRRSAVAALLDSGPAAALNFTAARDSRRDDRRTRRRSKPGKKRRGSNR